MSSGAVRDAGLPGSPQELLCSQIGRFGSQSIHVVGAEGFHVWDSVGRKYLDLNSGYWIALLGYGNKLLADVMRQASIQLSYAHLYRRTHEPAFKLALALARRAKPLKCVRVLYGNDGTGAVETAVRLALHSAARVATGADALCVLSGAYHGDSLLVREFGDYREKWVSTSIKGIRVLRLKAPPLRGGGSDAEVSAARRLLSQCKPVALLVECVQAGPGALPVDKRYLSQVVKLARARGALIIVDEVSTGLGRTGTFFAFQQWGFEPDMVVVGKGLAGGCFPLSAVLVGERAGRHLGQDGFSHGHTTSGHPIGCMVALEVLRMISRGRLVRRSEDLGNEVQTRLTKGLPTGVQIQGRGLMLGIDLLRVTTASIVRARCESHGVMVGQEGSVVTLFPPLNIPRSVLFKGIQILIGVINSTLQPVDDAGMR